MESLLIDFRQAVLPFSMARTATFSLKSALFVGRLFFSIVGPIAISLVQTGCQGLLENLMAGGKWILLYCSTYLPYVDRWYKSKDKESFVMARRMIKEEGLLCGGSSGSAMYCALQAVRDFGLKAGQRCVVVLPDSVRNYMTKFLSDDWMSQRDFLQVENTPDTIEWWCNLNVSALTLHVPLTVTPSVTLQETLDLLNREGFDQVPVVNEAGSIQGMVTVGNILAQMVKNKVNPSDPVTKIMYKQFKMIKMDTRLGQLSRMLDTDHFVLVVHDQRQYSGSSSSMEKKQMIFGIATRIDLLNFIASRKDQ